VKAWQNTLARVLGRSVGASIKSGPPTPMDKMDTMDKNPLEPNSVHIVHFVPGSSEVGLTADQWSEAESWPAPTGRVFLAIMRYLESQGIAYESATVGTYQATKALMERFGGPVQLVAEQIEQILPLEAQPEVDATIARLVAGSWKPERAKLLAKAIVARRLGLAMPPLSRLTTKTPPSP